MATTFRITLLSLFFLVAAFLGGGVSHVSAAQCGFYASGSDVPAGFGASWNVLTNALLIKPNCNATGATIDVGNGNTTEYIYRAGYEMRNGMWNPITFAGPQLVGGYWYVGRASAQVTRTADQMTQDNFVVAYVCLWTGAAWKCGCRDSACAASYWQVQGFKNTAVSGGQASLSVSATGNPRSGTAPLSVNFTSIPSGGTGAYTYNWDFGDGQTSTAQNVIHTYVTSGAMSARLTVTSGSASVQSSVISVNVSANTSVTLTASASGNPVSGSSPLTVAFSGSGQGGPGNYTYRWDFGDGQTSTLQNPSHTYASAGTYSARLTVTSEEYTAQSPVVTVTVSAPSANLSASASASPLSGAAPLSVNFTGSASGGTGGYTYSWNFGDGQTSTVQNPTHVYSTQGAKTARLTVTSGGVTAQSSTISINVTAAATALSVSASGNPLSGTSPLTVNFNGSASGGAGAYTYSWNFGDGQTSTAQNVSHAYTTAGTKTARLTVTSGGTTAQSAAISVNVTANNTVTLTTTEVATHASASNCWSIINGKVYNLTSLVNTHSGGSSPITQSCGTDGTSIFNSHHGTSYTLISSYLLGSVGATITKP